MNFIFKLTKHSSVHNEPEQNQVIQYYIDWILERATAKKTSSGAGKN
jgi:hypothetical protein